MVDLAARLRDLSYFADNALPRLGADYLTFDVSVEPEAREISERFAILPRGQAAPNLVHIHRNAGRLAFPTPFNFHGTNNNIIIGENSGFHGSIHFMGDDNLIVLAGHNGRLALEATLYDGNSLVCGRGTFAWGVRIWVQGGTVCTLGDDCLLSEDISIRTTDHHSMIDLGSGKQINAPRDVTIGKHVWIGPGCTINKGAEIGDGSIIAPQSVVTETIPQAECWGGVPARMIRRNVSWVRSHPAEAPEVDALFEFLKIPRRTRF
jgi:acetyltransferase-like isoleucine patch superfamily enzyme